MFTKAKVVAEVVRRTTFSVMWEDNMERRSTADKNRNRRSKVNAFLAALDMAEINGEEVTFFQFFYRSGGRSAVETMPADDEEQEEAESIDLQPRRGHADDTAEMMENLLPGPKEADAGAGAPPPRNTPLVRDLLEMFVQEGCRMSGGEAFLWLREHGKRYAEGTVKQTLCRMKREELVNNIEDGRGHGYGLLEWG